MRIRIGQINARCDACGGEDFQPLPGDDSAPHELACFGCGTVSTRRALLAQIAELTMRRARSFLSRSRKQRSEPRKA